MKNSIEDLFKEKFEQFEAPVSDGLWDKIKDNPTWKKHIRKQKISSLTVYGLLALCFLGTCTILLIHRHNQHNLEPSENTVMEEEFITDDPQDSVSPAISVKEVETSEVISTLPDEKQVSPVQQAISTPTEVIPSLPYNTNAKLTETTEYQSNTTPQNPSVAQNDKSDIPSSVPVAQENKDIKSGEGTPVEPTSTPSNTNNDQPNVSLLSIPNAFTPNGDGLNDFFRPVTAANLLQYQLDIFMMNGQHIFTSKNIEHGWNGEFHGRIMNGGSYIYIIKYKDEEGKEHIDKGQLLLIR